MPRFMRQLRVGLFAPIQEYGTLALLFILNFNFAAVQDDALNNFAL